MGMGTVVSENLLHLLVPYLPTDRFRALLAGRDLDEFTAGAAMFVDISGFTPLTVKLVEQYGPQRASEELKRRLNPMFEAIAGQVFTHGGSVIRFVGDGFTAWFPETLEHVKDSLPGVVRASVAAREMLEMMSLFRDLDIKVAVYGGEARRWVVGDPRLGLLDVLTGAAVEGVAEISQRYERHDARVNGDSDKVFSAFPEINYEHLENGDLLVKSIASPLVERSRLHRWPAWVATEDVDAVLERVRQFIDPLILEQESSGLGSIAGELRYATPVFLKFAGLDYNTDPQARQQLDSFVQDIQNILRETRGRLVSLEVADKGSVIFAVFGAPVAFGDDSQRAIHAALSFRDLPSVHPAIKSQSIGISRGLLYSGTVGGEARHEYTSLGDETNVASRLMSADKNGEILVSEAAYEDCSDWFDFKPGEIVYPKGRVGKIQTYTPIRVTRRFRRSLRKSPIVGREAELEIIQKALDAVKDSKPRIIRIEGEAGIGKSRLGAELTFLADSAGNRVVTGFCISTGKSVAFLPWRPIIRTLTETEDEWNDPAEVAHLTQWLPRQKQEWAVWLPLLGDLLGLDIPDNPTTRNLVGTARQQALFALVIDMLYHTAQTRPLTIIIEDTHWLDEVSEALLIELTSRLLIEPTGILLALLHRPAEEAEHPTAVLKALSEMYIHRHLVLNELNQQAVGQLLEGRLKGKIPPELTHFVYEKSQGNPFFAQQIVDALQDANVITRVGPQVYIDASLENRDLPQTVQGLIQARIDNLTEMEKLVLKLAAVIGRQFEVRVLYQSLPIEMTPETVMQHLRTLEKRKFAQLDALYPEPLYSFRHAITQEVTYQTLLHGQRQQWHRTVGLVLENLAPHSYERLAYHFAHSDDKERAFVYLVKAGDKSAYEFANIAALNSWGKALHLARSPKEEFDLLCKRLELLIRIGDRAATTADFERLVKLAATAPNNLNWQLRRLRYQAEHMLELGQWEQARQYAEDGVEISKIYHNPEIAWELHSILARVYSMLNKPDRHKKATQELRAISQQLKDPSKEMRLRLNDLLETAKNTTDSGQEVLEMVYEEIKKLADPMLEANYWNIRSRLSMQLQLYVQAETYLRTQLSLWRQVGNRRMEGQTLHDLGVTQYTLGQYSLANGHLVSSYKILNQIGDKWGESKSLVYLGAIAFRRNAPGEAIAYIRRGLAQQEELNVAGEILRSLYFLAQCEIAKKNYNEARTLFYKSVRIAAANNLLLETLPQLQLSVAYARAKSATLPMLEDFSTALQKLTSADFSGFHDPDLAFWEARELMSVFSMDLAPLKAAFQTYLDSRLNTLASDEDRATFLAIGHIPKLRDLMK